MTPRYVVVAEFQALARREQAFLELIERQARASLREEPGCLLFDVCIDPARPGAVLVYEIYRDAGAYADHRAHPRHPVFLREARRLVRLFDGQVFRRRQVLENVFRGPGRS